MKYLKTTLISTMVLISSVLATSANAAVILSFMPSSQEAATGDSVSMDLMISGLGDGVPDSLGTFDLDIGYDANRLTLSSYALGNSLGDANLGEALDFSLGDSGGLIGLTVISLLFDFELDSLQSDSFSLASFVFDVDDLELGESTAVIIDTVYGLGDSAGNALDITSMGSGVLVNPNPNMVSAPATLSLLALSFGLILLRRKG
jgi:hypothetical protein